MRYKYIGEGTNVRCYKDENTRLDDMFLQKGTIVEDTKWSGFDSLTIDGNWICDTDSQFAKNYFIKLKDHKECMEKLNQMVSGTAIEFSLINGKFEIDYSGCACGAFNEKLELEYCPICGGEFNER